MTDERIEGRSRTADEPLPSDLEACRERLEMVRGERDQWRENSNWNFRRLQSANRLHEDAVVKLAAAQARMKSLDADLRQLQGQIAEVVADLKRHAESYESQAEGRDAEDFEFLMDLSGVVNKWHDLLASWLPPQERT